MINASLGHGWGITSIALESLSLSLLTIMPEHDIGISWSFSKMYVPDCHIRSRFERIFSSRRNQIKFIIVLRISLFMRLQTSL